MARLLLATALLSIVTAHPARAQESSGTVATADEAPQDAVEQPALTGRLACIARAESRNDPNATNPRSGAMGLFQFMPSTWRTTPQGRAGLSAYDPVAATAAAEWMIAQGRVREWSVVQMGICW